MSGLSKSFSFKSCRMICSQSWSVSSSGKSEVGFRAGQVYIWTAKPSSWYWRSISCLRAIGHLWCLEGRLHYVGGVYMVRSWPNVSLVASGIKRAMAAATLRQEYQPLVTASISLIRYLSGCWEGSFGWVSTPSAILSLSITYRLNTCPVGKLSAGAFKRAPFSYSKSYSASDAQDRVKGLFLWASLTN